MSWSNAVQTAANLAVIVGAIVAIPLYFIERSDAKHLERQQIAADMFLHKYDDRVISAYAKVSNAYDSRNALFPVFSGQQTEAKKALAIDILEEAGLENVRIIADYYDDILICTDQGVCDKEMADSLIGNDISNFYCKARYVGLPELRERYSYAQYGVRLERYASACR